MILVFTNKVSNSLHYILKEIIVNQLHQSFEITQNKSHYLQASADIKIYYTENQIPDFEGYWVPNSNFLFTENFISINPKNDLPIGIIQFPKNSIIDSALDNICKILSINNELKNKTTEFSNRYVYFPISSPLGFDVFAHVFALIANVEESLIQFQKKHWDKHGRFETNQLNLVQNNMHLLPMADLAIQRLEQYLGLCPSKEKKFCVIPTADIDQCFQFKGKSLKKFIGGGIKHPSTLPNRIEYMFTRNDHFSPSKSLATFLAKNPKSQIFWLVNSTETDKNKQIPRENADFQSEIKNSKSYANLGIHPSYQNSKNHKIYQEEKNWLEHVTNENIENSRQHYLHFELPQTYLDLESMGIKHDWSMGFSNTVGFRNGSSIPVKWFNIFDNKEHELSIHSFSIMDVTCKNYLKLNLFDSIILGNSLKQIIQQINGQYTFIIHNESYSEKDGWKGWRTTFNSWASTI